MTGPCEGRATTCATRPLVTDSISPRKRCGQRRHPVQQRQYAGTWCRCEQGVAHCEHLLALHHALRGVELEVGGIAQVQRLDDSHVHLP